MSLKPSLFRLFLTLLWCSLVCQAFAQEEEPLSPGDSVYAQVRSQMGAGNLDSAYFLLELAKSTYRNEKDWEGMYQSTQGLMFISWRKGNTDKAFSFIDSMLLIAGMKGIEPDERAEMLGKAYGYGGVFKAGQGHYTEAINNYEKAIGQFKAMEQMDSVSLATQWNNLANVHSDRGDYEKAQSCFEQTLALLEGNFKRLDVRASALNNLGQIKYRLEVYPAAKAYFLRAFNLYQAYARSQGSKNFGYSENFTVACNNLGKTYLQLNQLDSSAFYLELARNTQVTRKLTRQQPLTNLFLGQLYLKKGKTDQGIATLEKGLQQAIEQFELPNTYVARCYFSLAEAKKNQGELQNALNLYLKSSEALVHRPLNNGLPENQEDVASEMELLKTLTAKAELLWQLYQKRMEKAFLEEAFRHYQFIDELILNARQSYLEDNSKHYLAEKSHEIFGRAIRVAATLFRENGEQKYLEAAFAFMESNKATALLESLKENEARMFTRLRETARGKVLLREEEKLKMEIAGFRRSLYETEQKQSEKIKQINAALFERKEAFSKVRKQLEEEFPEYYKLKYDPGVATIKQLQAEILAADERLVQYYVNKNLLICLVVGSNYADIFELEVTEAQYQALETFLRQISSFSFYQEAELAFSEFTQAAFAVYSMLIEPIEEGLPRTGSKLIIVPDGLINFVSFQALLSRLPEDENKIDYSLNNLSYLLEDYQIRYAYSASQLAFFRKKNQSRSKQKGFVGFAPYFGEGNDVADARRTCEEENLAPLTENEYEVRAIAKLVNGKSYIGEKANVSVFKKVADQYSILHLATHACSQADAPLYQKIFFGQEDYLYTFDLYDLDLAADLVVLSACETGIGRLVEGEGVLSLARGFAYAGSPSILTTLWSVSDRSTADIMVEYYRKLQEGQSKSQALREAQLDYLKDQKPDLMHPVYWAGFVQVGLDEAIDFRSKGWMTYYILAALIFLLGIFFIRKRSIQPTR